MTFSKLKLLSRTSKFSALCCHCEIPATFAFVDGKGQTTSFGTNCGYTMQHTRKLKEYGGKTTKNTAALFPFTSSFTLRSVEMGACFPRTLSIKIKEISSILWELKNINSQLLQQPVEHLGMSVVT